MNLIDWITWLIWGLIGLIYLGMVILLWWALFGDRARGRRRCPKCWYDMSYSSGTLCAECGYAATEEAQLCRTRRRPLWGILAVTVCLALSVLINERLRQNGWISMTSDRMLVLALPWSGQPPNPVADQLIYRARRGTLSTRHQQQILRRAVVGDRWASPVDDNWRQKYAPFIDDWRFRTGGGFNVRMNRANTLDAIDEMLLQLPPLIDVRVPERLPRDFDPFVTVVIQDWWPLGTRSRVQIFEGGGSEDPLYTLFHGSQLPQRNSLVIALPESMRQVDLAQLEFRIDHYDLEAEAWKEAHMLTVGFTTAHVDQEAEPLTPVRDETIDQHIRNSVNGTVVRWREGVHPIRFQYQPAQTYIPEMDDLAIGLELTLRRNGQKARQITMWWLAGTNVPGGGSQRERRRFGWEVVYENRDLLFTPDREDDTWIMEVVGRPSLAARASTTGAYWDGQYTVPAQIRRAGRVAPVPESWRPEHDPDYDDGTLEEEPGAF